LISQLLQNWKQSITKFHQTALDFQTQKLRPNPLLSLVINYPNCTVTYYFPTLDRLRFIKGFYLGIEKMFFLCKKNTLEKDITAIDGFYHQSSRKVIDNYQIILTFDDIFLVNAGNDYSQFVKSVFSGIGDLVGMVKGPIGMLGGLASEIGGGKVSEVFKSFAENKSAKNVQKILANLDEYAKRNDTEKVEFGELEQIIVRNGISIFRKPSIEFVLIDKTIKLQTDKKEKIEAFKNALILHPFSIKVIEKWW